VVDDISHEGLRLLLRQKGAFFQVLRTLEDQVPQTSRQEAPHPAPIRADYGLMDGTDDVLDGDPDVAVCVDEFGPLNLQPHPGGSG
jgi:hypothetical protein